MALGRTLGEIAAMPAAELDTWRAFYHLDPWGEQRADLRNALVATILANANRRKGAPAFKLRDFMLYAEEEHRQTPEEIKAAFMAAFRAVGRRKAGT